MFSSLGNDAMGNPGIHYGEGLSAHTPKLYPLSVESSKERFDTLVNGEGEALPLIVPSQIEIERLRSFDIRITSYLPDVSNITHPFTKVINKLRYVQIIDPLVHIIQANNPHALLRGVKASLNNPVRLSFKDTNAEVLDIRQILELGIERDTPFLADQISDSNLMLNELPPHVSGYAFSGLLPMMQNMHSDGTSVGDIFPVILVYPSSLKPIQGSNYQYPLPKSLDERKKMILQAYILPQPSLEAVF
ncbi:MAG TPA: hypothetical protein PLV59_00555 [Candidatus Dojkabacteria bacterium]|nr:hypothetical protein [Candidatus Dojkabacteria bacterium]